LNLLKEKWIKAIVKGQNQPIGVSDIANSDVTDLAFARLDFNGAIYQLLIGLLQTAYAPKSIDGWTDLYYKPPGVDELVKAFALHEQAFDLLPAKGPAFMQDLTLTEGEAKSVAALLIEAPGGKTIKDNTDHFTKRGFADKMCPSCAAAALYCLQCSAPSGGVGHRTSLRGGGGLTTLIKPKGASSLWQKLWLNVLPQDEPALKTEHLEPQDTFPWLAPSKTSEKKGTEILPDQVNRLQMYWGMPRRIRLDKTTLVAGHCDLCGCEGEQHFSRFITKNYGPNYGDGWLHFLTPYREDVKKKTPPLSIKGKQGGLSYKDWLGIAIGDDKAIVVHRFLAQKWFELEKEDRQYQLWCFGYDMDNMKARCWYEHNLPLVDIPAKDNDLVTSRLAEYLELAKGTAATVKKSVKLAWFKRPKDAKGDMSKVDIGFWQATETDFFELVNSVIDTNHDRARWVECDKLWRGKMRHQLEHQFEHWALDKFTGDKDLPRIMQARKSLLKDFKSLKTYKNINERVNAAQKENA
jgi:CRISPR system Cascade subunit CasA